MDDNMFVFGEENEEDNTAEIKEALEEEIDSLQEKDLAHDEEAYGVEENSVQQDISVGEKHYYKKKRGIAGFFQKLGIKLAEFWRTRKKWQKVLIITITAVVLVLAIVTGILFSMFNYNYNDLPEDNSDLGFSEIIDEKIINVALFGIDSRTVGSFSGLSDSIMILSMNTETKKIKVISVMRDSLVPIEYNGRTYYSKINSAYSRGGPQLAVKTLNKCFNLDISEYATVNFYGMTDIIDAVGGIEVTLTPGELNCHRDLNYLIKEQARHMRINPTPHYIYTPGKKHLNGIQAVAYARIRYASNFEGISNDQGRTARQRYVMEQLMNKAIKLEKSKYLNLIKALIPCSETSLSIDEIFTLATEILLHSPTFEQSRIPLDEYQMSSIYVSGSGSCIYYDLNYAAKVLHAFIYDDIDPKVYMEQNGIEKNPWYQGSTYTPNTQSKPSTSSSKPPQNSNSSNSSSSQSSSSSQTDSTVSSSSDSTGSTSSSSSSTNSGNLSGTESTDSSSSEVTSSTESNNSTSGPAESSSVSQPTTEQ